MADLTGLSATELARRIGAGEIGRREVAAAHLERIEADEERVGAFSQRFPAEQVLAEATATDRERTAGVALPLDGVPMIVKETFDVVGLASSEGVRARADRRPAADALPVARLRAAGALILGKGKQPDFKSRWNTISELHGATRNPRDPSRSAGGSSGGDAAAVAAGFAAAGFGSDYGGSIRIPAAFCGIAGMRTSPGLIPDVDGSGVCAGPPTAMAMSSLGPLARTVEDLRVLLEVTLGPAAAAPGSERVAPQPAGPRRVARLCTELGASVEAAVARRLDTTCEALAAAGYEVVEADLPGGPRLPELFAELVGTELLEFGLPGLEGEIGEESRRYLELMFGRCRLGGIAALISAQTELSERASALAVWMAEHPLVVAPVAGIEPPLLEFDRGLTAAAATALFDQMRNAVWVNLFGLPALALPNGIQIVGRRFAEDEVLAAAALAEPFS